VQNCPRLCAAVDFDRNRVKALAHSNQREEIRNDVKLTDGELLADFPVGKTPLELEISERGNADPRLDDGQVVFEAATWNAADDGPMIGEEPLRGWAEAVDVFLTTRRRQKAQMTCVEEPSETNGRRVPANTGKGVADEVRGSGEAESREGVQNRLIALGDLDGDTLLTPVARLTTSRPAHVRNGFLTGSPHRAQGT
jgi:hypothetical protein